MGKKSIKMNLIILLNKSFSLIVDDNFFIEHYSK